MQLKSPRSYHLTLFRMAISKRPQITGVGDSTEKREPFYTIGGNVNWYNCYGEWAFLTQVRSLGQGRSLGEGNGNPLWYSCLENSMDRGAWWATVHGVAKSGTMTKWLTLSLLWITVWRFLKKLKIELPCEPSLFFLMFTLPPFFFFFKAKSVSLNGLFVTEWPGAMFDYSCANWWVSRVSRSTQKPLGGPAQKCSRTWRFHLVGDFFFLASLFISFTLKTFFGQGISRSSGIRPYKASRTRWAYSGDLIP